jgi:hypothetical protein
MVKLGLALSAVVAAFGLAGGIKVDAGAGQNASSHGHGSSSAGVEDVEIGHQLADVSGEQACGGAGFDYARYWVGALTDGDDTKLNCVSGYRCEAQRSSEMYWCKQFALPLNAKCGGYLFYTLFKCVEGTTCTIDSARFEPRCLPSDSA